MWTKSQKISAGLLGVAVVAFGVDRWVLSPSSEVAVTAPASEYAVGSDTTSSAASTSKATAATPPKASGLTLASRLSDLATARRFQYMTSPDAFRASDEWRGQAAAKRAAQEGLSPGAAPSETTAVAKATPGRDFARSHSLSAILNTKSGGMAIVNGKLYEVGAVIDGFTLTKVGTIDVTFTGKDTEATLKLPGQLPVARIEE